MPGSVAVRSVALPLIVALGTLLGCGGEAPSELDRYVGKDDGAYAWEEVSRSTLPGGGGAYRLRLTSQQWRDTTWRHTLFIVAPDRIESRPTLVLLVVAGDSGGGDATLYGAAIASGIGAPVAVLHDVPNQPLLGGLREDALIAETFDRYMQTGDATWPLLLPMVKSAVRAMDAIEEFVEAELGVPVSGFVVTGGSKRGWTTWLAAAVDSRVQAIAPMAYDNLNLAKQMEHQLEAWGSFSSEVSDYTEIDIPQRLVSGDEAALDLEAIVDPFAFRARITAPKLMITGTNDSFWPLDALDLYYDDLVGDRHILYVPNAGHGLGSGITRTVSGIVALFLAADGRLSFPDLGWESRAVDGALQLALTSDMEPESVSAWAATSPTRDFRAAEWEDLAMKPEGGAYTLRLDLPGEGYVAVFGDAEFPLSDGFSYFLSTRVSIFRGGERISR